MVFDDLSNFKKYFSLLPSLVADIEELLKMDLSAYKNGDIILEKTNYYVLYINYENKQNGNILWEKHKKFADIHIMISGNEECFVSQHDSDEFSGICDYDVKHDVMLGYGSGMKYDLSKNVFIVIFPYEPHTCLPREDSDTIKKIVIKLNYQQAGHLIKNAVCNDS